MDMTYTFVCFIFPSLSEKGFVHFPQYLYKTGSLFHGPSPNWLPLYLLFASSFYVYINTAVLQKFTIYQFYRFMLFATVQV